MPAPSVFEEGRIDPFERLSPEQRRFETEILYATDRDPAGRGDPEPHYANRRGYLVRLGRADIVHGDGRLSPEEARLISLAREREQSYRLRVGDVDEIGILAESTSPFTDPVLLPTDPEAAAARFAAAVNRQFEESTSRDIDLYVHGHKVPFEDPLLVGTELWHFMGYDGVLLPYPWPATTWS